MGHAAKNVDNRCDTLDEIEAAITLKKPIRVWFEDGAHRMGLPTDLYTKDHEDFLQLENHLPIPVSRIVRIDRLE